MVATPVEAVWIWYYGQAAQKATYGRFNDPEDKSYTKDYLQASGDCSSLLDEFFTMPASSDTRAITYHWPGGSASGSIKHPNDRHHLRWGTAAGAPAPWRLTPDPTEAGPGTLPGDPTKSDISGADAALAAYTARGLKAYLVAVKLVGEDDSLHIRAYIDTPPDDLGFASADHLPRKVREAMARATPTKACSSLRLDSRTAQASSDLAPLIEKLEDNPNLLLIGPPGTGKTVALEKLARYIAGSASGICFDPTKNHDAWNDSDSVVEAGKSATVVFHPSYSYENLVVGLLPRAGSDGVSVTAKTGPLVNLAKFASSGGTALLVLDEFNRGNAAAILGDTLALLDKDKRGSVYVDLPTYGLDLHVPAEFAVDGDTRVDAKFTLPRNLWIVAAMNSSDRSVAPLDAALRRRFSIEEIEPDYDLLGRRLGSDDQADVAAPWDEWTPESVATLAVELLRGINARIDASLGRDFRLGHSNFWHVGGETAEDALRSLASAWDLRVVQTVRLALQDDDDTLAFILKAGRSSDAATNSSQAAWWKKADPAHEQFARPRLNFNALSDMSTDALHPELVRLAEA
ncbi:McrB family protein [Nocardia asteroides]|uniref:McrB family protein n=1 Tax=Nocardia asteroides TaxID=1824 RepID=UPI0033D6569A